MSGSGAPEATAVNHLHRTGASVLILGVGPDDLCEQSALGPRGPLLFPVAFELFHVASAAVDVQAAQPPGFFATSAVRIRVRSRCWNWLSYPLSAVLTGAASMRSITPP